MQFLTKLLAIPIDQGAPGDVEPLGDAAQAPALGPEFEELVFRINVVHNSARFFRRAIIMRLRRAQEESSIGFGQVRGAQESELH